ncbi:hypothetical protein [Bradyrhizobium ottawaense]|uniref:hypothetical protein n=1 Tax=Bradyrhizobium ottawaense TaxID=931866 RepID=UPI001BA6BE62|nr:hypothetical protein [Bradyrhizobium ottawaense]MBR1328833.1 hypothetical protein [Bradyrhizobium ottawaense]
MSSRAIESPRIGKAALVFTLWLRQHWSSNGRRDMVVDWREYAKGIEKQLEQLRRDLQPLESGSMKLGEREGSGAWRDVTQEAIDRNRQVIATYEAILKDVRENRIKD